MRLKSTPEVVQALTNLRGNADFQEVLKWVKENELSEAHTCVEQDGLPLYRAQGSAKTLAEFATIYENAPSILEKFKKATTKG